MNFKNYPMVDQNLPTVELWREKMEVKRRKAKTEPSMNFLRANTEPPVHFRRANTETYYKNNVNLSKRVGKDRVFLGLAGLLLRISFGLCPREIPRSRPASPRKTLSFPPLLLRLTQYVIRRALYYTLLFLPDLLLGPPG